MSHRTTSALVLLTAGTLAMTAVTTPAAFAANPHEASQSGAAAPASSVDVQSGAPQSGGADEAGAEGAGADDVAAAAGAVVAEAAVAGRPVPVVEVAPSVPAALLVPAGVGRGARVTGG